MKSFIEKVKAQFFNRETLSYIIVGGISTVANWIATYILNNVFHWGYWLTSIVTFAVGMIFTFVANRKFTFRSDLPVKVLFPRFVLNVAVCFGISYGLMQAVLGWFFANVWAPPRIAGPAKYPYGHCGKLPVHRAELYRAEIFRVPREKSGLKKRSCPNVKKALNPPKDFRRVFVCAAVL